MTDQLPDALTVVVHVFVQLNTRNVAQGVQVHNTVTVPVLTKLPDTGTRIVGVGSVTLTLNVVYQVVEVNQLRV
jgi:hypothetical protein